MSKGVISVRPDSSLNDAISLTRTYRIKHLVVLDENERLAGIVSSHDIKQTVASPANSLSVHELNYLIDQITVDSFMTRNVITVNPGTTVERAAYIMQKNAVSALPVMDGNRVVGIITSTDVMRVLLEAIGMSDETMRLIVYVKDRIGAIADVATTLRDHCVNIQSLVTWPENNDREICQLVMRIHKQDKEKAVFALKNQGFNVLTSYVEDPTPFFN
jgi:acetoin utilization protein AcuB